MEKETQNAQPAENEISFESVSDLDDDRPGEFIEPLKEIDDSPEGEAEINLNRDMSDKKQIDTEVPDQESSDDVFPEDDALLENDGLTEQERVEAPIADREDQSAEDAEEAAADPPETATEDVADGPEDNNEYSTESPAEKSVAEPEDLLPEDPAADLENDDFELGQKDEDATDSSESAYDSDTEFPDYEELSNDEMDLEEDDPSDGNDDHVLEEPAEENRAAEMEPLVAASRSVPGKKKNTTLTKLALCAIITIG